jgi:protein ImuA
MLSNGFMAEDRFAALRLRIARIEGRPAGIAGTHEAIAAAVVRPASLLLPFAVPRLDHMLSGGLRRHALHEIRSALTRDAAAATGFAAAILSRLSGEDERPILWIVEAAAGNEAGLPYGVGFDRFGLDSNRLIVVRVKKPGDALWVFEEALACRGLAAVLTEIRGSPGLLDLTASRRLALRARAGGVMGLLLRQCEHAEPGAATTRWLVAPRPATTLDDYPAGIGEPAWQLTLERNRAGATGTFDVEWDHVRRSFVPLAATGAAGAPHSLPVAAVPVDRSHPPAHAGSLVA